MVPSPTPPDQLPPFDSVSRYTAIQLFAEGASAARPGFALATHDATAVTHIWWRLDRMTIAIELTAARTNLKDRYGAGIGFWYRN